MKTNQTFISLAILASAITLQTACSNGSGHSSGGGSSSANNAQIATIDLKPYYFAPDTCDREGVRYYRKLATFGTTTLATNLEQNVAADAYLEQNGRFTMDLEIERPAPEYGPHIQVVIENDHVEGIYRINESVVSLEGLGTMTEVSYGNGKALQLVINANGQLSKYNGTILNLEQAWGNYAPPGLARSCQ